MKKHYFIKILPLFALLFMGSFSLIYAVSSSSKSLDVNLHVGSCIPDGFCDPLLEDFYSCLTDCTPVVVPPTEKNGGVIGSLIMNNVFNDLTV